MKKLLAPTQLGGQQVDRIVAYDHFMSILFRDETAFVLQTLPGETIDVCRRLDEIFDPIEELGLLTAADIEAQQAKKREIRRKEFLKLKAEFEPS